MIVLTILVTLVAILEFVLLKYSTDIIADYIVRTHQQEKFWRWFMKYRRKKGI